MPKKLKKRNIPTTLTPLPLALPSNTTLNNTKLQQNYASLFNPPFMAPAMNSIIPSIPMMPPMWNLAPQAAYLLAAQNPSYFQSQFMNAYGHVENKTPREIETSFNDDDEEDTAIQAKIVDTFTSLLSEIVRDEVDYVHAQALVTHVHNTRLTYDVSNLNGHNDNALRLAVEIIHQVVFDQVQSLAKNVICDKVLEHLHQDSLEQDFSNLLELILHDLIEQELQSFHVKPKKNDTLQEFQYNADMASNFQDAQQQLLQALLLGETLDMDPDLPNSKLHLAEAFVADVAFSMLLDVPKSC